MAYMSASNGSLQPVFLAVMIFLLLLSTTIVALRLYRRIFIFLVHKVGLDDYIILSGFVVTIGMEVMNAFYVSFGTGRHLADRPLQEILISTLKHWYVHQPVYPLSIGLIKFSILAQYYRIFAVDGFRKAVLGVGPFVFAYTIIVVFAFEYHSKPWRAWDLTFLKGCNDLQAAMTLISDMTDFDYLYALIDNFLSGAFASVALIVRLNGLYKYNITKDVSYDAIQILFWSQIEVNVAIISASALSLRPLFANVFKSLSYVRYYGGLSNNVYGVYSTRSNHRRTLRLGTNFYTVDVNISGENTATSRDGSEERILLEPKANIMKTVVVEMLHSLFITQTYGNLK
ncbi:hypothetical protein BDV41DRAFT_591041 [Aspergillus transmontanensis]|uniref:Rhodopsin domain-containing protein n=1 Tax=Aspergillus transmontanensis TaxID=1034304 RepID=A0A5N6WET4_9EURO|nr:hypothetical protein BDV41DRAFT_591041 [Aspergillus transmontanensis]